MRRLSVKARLTLWITLMMLLLVAAVLAVLVTVSSSVVTESAYDQLESTVRANLNGISHTGGTLSFQEGFAFTKSGVYTLVYSCLLYTSSDQEAVYIKQDQQRQEPHNPRTHLQDQIHGSRAAHAAFRHQDGNRAQAVVHGCQQRHRQQVRAVNAVVFPDVGQRQTGIEEALTHGTSLPSPEPSAYPKRPHKTALRSVRRDRAGGTRPVSYTHLTV